MTLGLDTEGSRQELRDVVGGVEDPVSGFVSCSGYLFTKLYERGRDPVH